MPPCCSDQHCGLIECVVDGEYTCPVCQKNLHGAMCGVNNDDEGGEGEGVNGVFGNENYVNAIDDDDDDDIRYSITCHKCVKKHHGQAYSKAQWNLLRPITNTRRQQETPMAGRKRKAVDTTAGTEPEPILQQAEVEDFGDIHNFEADATAMGPMTTATAAAIATNNDNDGPDDATNNNHVPATTKTNNTNNLGQHHKGRGGRHCKPGQSTGFAKTLTKESWYRICSLFRQQQQQQSNNNNNNNIKMSQVAFLRSSISGHEVSGTQSDQQVFSKRLKEFADGTLQPSKTKRQKVPQFSEVETKIVAYVKFRLQRHKREKLGITWAGLTQMAIQFAATEPDPKYRHFRASSGWMQKLMQRNGITNVNSPWVISDLEGAEEALEELKAFGQARGLALEDIQPLVDFGQKLREQVIMNTNNNHLHQHQHQHQE